MRSLLVIVGLGLGVFAGCDGLLGDASLRPDEGMDGGPHADSGPMRIDAGPRDAMIFSGDGACVSPGAFAPIVNLPCDPVVAEPGCLAGSHHAPSLRWSFDPGAPMADSSAAGARPIANSLDAVSDSTAVGGGFAYVHAPDSLLATTGSADIVATPNATIEMMIRFRVPIDWSGTPGSAHGNRTDLFRFGGAAIGYSRDGFYVACGDERAPFDFNGGGVASWAHVADGEWHHLAAVISDAGAMNSVTLWIDGESPAEFSASVTAAFTALTYVLPGNYETKGIDIDELSLYPEALSNNFIAQRARDALAGMQPSDDERCEPRQCTHVAHDAGIVPELFEPGFDLAHPYAPSMSTDTQITTAPLPRHKRGHTMPRVLAFWSHGPYSVATEDPVAYTHPNVTGVAGASQREVDAIRAVEANELALRWNFSVNGALTGDGGSHPDDNPYTQFLRSIPDEWPLEGMCGIANEGAIGVHVYDTDGSELGASPAGVLADYQAFGYSECGRLGSTFETLVGHKLDLFEFDIEGPSSSVFQIISSARWDAVKDLPANAVTKAYCDGLGLVWRECLAHGISEMHQAIIDGALQDFTATPAAHVYSVSGNEAYDGDYRYTRLQNDPTPQTIDPLSDGSDRFRYSTPYIYPNNAYRWYYTLADRRGISWLLDARQAEIDAGSPWTMPYVSPGWSYSEEKNIRPGQWLGMLKVMGAAGALSYIPGFFVIPTDLGGGCSWGVCNDLHCADGDSACMSQTVQNPNHHAWQTLIPSYAQGVISRAEDILRSPSSQWLGQITTSTPAVAATAHRLGTRVLIAVALMPNSNDASSYQVTSTAVTVGIDHDGNEGTPLRNLRLDARVQGSVYIADFATTPATLIQLDAWNEFTHPTRWTTDFQFDAEVFDASSDVGIESEAPNAAMDDFRGLTAYVSVSPSRASESFGAALSSAPQVEMDFEARETASYQVWVRLRTTSASPGSAYVWLDDAVGEAQMVGCESSPNWTWVRLNCDAGGDPTTLMVTGDVRHVLHVAPSHGAVQIDRVLLTLDTMCIDDAPSCTCG